MFRRIIRASDYRVTVSMGSRQCVLHELLSCQRPGSYFGVNSHSISSDDGVYWVNDEIGVVFGCKDSSDYFDDCGTGTLCICGVRFVFYDNFLAVYSVLRHPIWTFCRAELHDSNIRMQQLSSGQENLCKRSDLDRHRLRTCGIWTIFILLHKPEQGGTVEWFIFRGSAIIGHFTKSSRFVEVVVANVFVYWIVGSFDVGSCVCT